MCNGEILEVNMRQKNARNTSCEKESLSQDFMQSCDKLNAPCDSVACGTAFSSDKIKKVFCVTLSVSHMAVLTLTLLMSSHSILIRLRSGL